MELEQIKTMIERALADKRLSPLESDSIKAAIYSDKKVTPEEAELFRNLQEQIWNGDVIIEE
ncbi:hypothetical protein [Aphanothece sacrum]|uniref:Uncharacterized protein n=1 Tax=Aphanothece sacrum FPU1 TaxID=1920663 RepID=A0A401IJ14_APHSA|nr:hypothetical protein [Aphanothece sacrum]GBF81091.1 hypothetical protein AsFPU1_2501 [Aphanothece sacrum FPU1]GBF85492.1 hypothetical protein AsFPU3_2552 [Aphanothece sacrum FPU3]